MQIKQIQEKLDELKEENAFNKDRVHDYQAANSLHFRTVLNLAQTADTDLIEYFDQLAKTANDLKTSIQTQKLTHVNAEIISKEIYKAVKEKEIPLDTFE
jgi:isopropylmalate/homocitrate/citramalate synthase